MTLYPSFLFLLVMDILSRIVTKGVQGQVIEPFEEVALSHLQFADDTIFFCFGKVDPFFLVNNILAFFETMSGLRINMDECQIMGIKCDLEKLKSWVEEGSCDFGSFPSSYLGFPLGSNLKTVSFWNLMVDKVRKRLASWKKSFVSGAGRVMLIRFILSGIPMFRAPSLVGKNIEKHMRSFLWEGVEKVGDHIQ